MEDSEGKVLHEPEHVRVLRDLFADALVIHDAGSWPAAATLTIGDRSLPIDLYTRAISGSSRGNASERRFQNPDRGIAIRDPGERTALLLGLWQEQGLDRTVVVAFDAYRRIGKTTRFSLFMPLALLEEAADTGYSTHVTASDEVLYAFRPEKVATYLEDLFRTAPWTNRPLQKPTRTIREGEEMAVARRSPAQQIAQHLSTRLPKVANPPVDQAWLDAFYERAGLPKPSNPSQQSGGSEAALVRHALEKLGGHWRSDFETAGRPTEGAMLELSELVGLHADIQERLGEKRKPFLSDADLWTGLHAQCFPDADEPEFSEDLVRSIVSHATELSIDALPSDLITALGIPSKLALSEVAALLDRNADAAPEAKPETTDEGDDAQGESPAAVAAELAMSPPIDGEPRNLHLPSLMEDIVNGDLLLNPPWQRGDVWSLAKKRSLVESLLLGIPLPSLILHWERDKQITVIDGKQRLTAIYQFINDGWPLGRYPGSERLADVSNKKYSQLPNWARRKIKDTQVAVLKFEGLTPGVLYRIFELYNVTGMRLNAVEIRNAVFHAHPVHEMAFVLAGEGKPEARAYLDSAEEQAAFTSVLRATVAPGRQVTRYATLDFLCRYLAYSRAPLGRSGRFTPESTTKLIRQYFEATPLDDPRAVAREIVDVFAATRRLFGAANVDPFGVKQNGKIRFNRLMGTASLTATKICLAAKSLGIDDAAVITAVGSVAARVLYPPKQTTASIWTFHARFVVETVRALGLTAEQLEATGLRHLYTSMETVLS